MNFMLEFETFWDDIDKISEADILNNINFLRSENRSSTIFPIYKDSSTKTSIHFLSYWLKKHGNKVVARYIVRDLEGHELIRNHEIITVCKAYSFTVSDYFPLTEIGFCGSVEVEIFSKTAPYLTFPAVTVCYHGFSSCSVVHSCIRTYNKGETVTDYAIMFPQTGFDVELNKENRNFISFFGGYSKKYNLEIELVEENLIKKYSVEIDNVLYGQSHFIWLEDILPKSDLELLKKPKCLIYHDLKDVFPRFYVGIRSKSYAPTITHTFFDTSKAEEENKSSLSNLRAQNPDPINYFDASFSIPIFPVNDYDTVLRTYGQNLKFYGVSLVFIYTPEGELLYSRNLNIEEVFVMCGEGSLDLNKIIQNADLNRHKKYCVRFAYVNEKVPFPKRFKLGLNVKKKEASYGTNICFAPLVSSKKTFNKPFNRRWFPLGGEQKYVATIHNTTFDKSQSMDFTECNFEFFNHQQETFSRRINILKNGSVFLDVNQDKELSNFFGNEGGWCMVRSNTYHCDSYYFSMTEKQIGGDHAY